ncbi:MAG TPA: right-handed parallel beta-helix repeat-containing protein [Candidatus Deferrimicrobium sp.]|nr:right-handed parallel beta-helix repeat-containing protein [Candidatus Deferrimicrobium sp.]
MVNVRPLLFLAATMAVLSSLAVSKTIHVPADSATIQTGIDGAVNGDTVLVAPGTYSENIVFTGFAIKVLSSGGTSATFLQPAASAVSIVRYNSGESVQCVLAGFTLQHSGPSPAVEINGSSPTVRNNVFYYNNKETGWMGPSVVEIASDAAPDVHHNLFYDNNGFASVAIDGAARVFNNTIVKAFRFGFDVTSSSAIVVNNIFVACGQSGITAGSSTALMDYNNYWDMDLIYYPGTTPGPHDMSIDPLFVDPSGKDFSLLYRSPCINAGHPDLQYAESDGTQSDLGALPWFFDPPAPVDMAADSGTLIPTFTWSYVDTAATTQQGCEIEVGTDRSWDVAEMWASGQILSNDIFAAYSGLSLTDRGLYYYRIRLYNGSHWGSWVEGRFAVQIGQFQVIHVPGDVPTIQAGIDAALTGDTVRVADGTYTGAGNHDLDFWGKNIVLESENGPQTTIIDCQASSSDQHRGFYVHYGEDSTCVIKGFTVTGAYDAPDPYYDKAAILCRSSTPTIQNCIITDNACCGVFSTMYPNGTGRVRIIDCTISFNTGFAGVYVDWGPAYLTGSEISLNDGYGAFIYSVYNLPTEVSRSLFQGNEGYAGLLITQSMAWSNIRVSNCTFVGNTTGFVADWDWAKGYGALSGSVRQASSSVNNNISSFNTERGMVLNAPFDYDVICNNSVGNPSGNWIGRDFGPGDTFGNLSLEPLFCDTATDDFHIYDNSPCAPTNNSCHTLIGLLDVGCRCCAARGNVDGLIGPSGPIDVADLTYLVAHLFSGGPYPPCPEQANVDGVSGPAGPIDVADLTFLVAYQFQGGTPPPACP